MPWISKIVQEQRSLFITEYLRGDLSVSALCRKFSISRKTAYKWINRYKESGIDGLKNRSSAPLSNSRALSDDIICLIIKSRQEHPFWGARKLKIWINKQYPHLNIPAASTIGALLDRYGFIETRKKRRRTPPHQSRLSQSHAPNDLWCADFKGHFKMKNKKRCHPLTITDAFSRYILVCEGFTSPSYKKTQNAFEKAFHKYGLPSVIRTDNGTPFASTGAGGLSSLSVWWIKLGIFPERIDVGHPEQNGQHERMHRTLKQETTNPAKENLKAQQYAFDVFQKEYNEQRPHEALDYKTPASIYHHSSKKMPQHLLTMRYPENATLRKVISNGRIRWQGNLTYIHSALSGENVALTQRDDLLFNVHFGPIYLGCLDPTKPQLGLICPKPRRARFRSQKRNF